MNNDPGRLAQQIDFILEIDKLKQVIRRSYLVDASRRENTAEHSWHLAMMALLLCEHANEAVDPGRVMKMVLVHDIVEIDAGDTYLHDPVGALDKAEREQAAAERLFGLLPADQGRELRQLWQEFEARQTAEARFANALDRLMPLLHNLRSGGRTWWEHNITRSQVIDRVQHIGQGSETLWAYAQTIIAQAVELGYLRPE